MESLGASVAQGYPASGLYIYLDQAKAALQLRWTWKGALSVLGRGSSSQGEVGGTSPGVPHPSVSVTARCAKVHKYEKKNTFL